MLLLAPKQIFTKKIVIIKYFDKILNETFFANSDSLNALHIHIEDEFDDADEEFVWLSEDKARARASLHIEDLADELKIEIEKSDYEDIDSVGGLMAQKLGRVPIAGSTISWEGWAITSERPQGRRRRISSVLVERLEEEIEDAE